MHHLPGGASCPRWVRGWNIRVAASGHVHRAWSGAYTAVSGFWELVWGIKTAFDCHPHPLSGISAKVCGLAAILRSSAWLSLLQSEAPHSKQQVWEAEGVVRIAVLTMLHALTGAEHHAQGYVKVHVAMWRCSQTPEMLID